MPTSIDKCAYAVLIALAVLSQRP